MGTLCVSGSAIKAAGANINTNLSAGSVTGGDGSTFIVDEWILQNECVVNCATRKNWIDAYSSLNADVKLILQETVAVLTAIKCISYDMSGYTSRGEAEDMVTILRDIGLRNISILRDKKTEDFMVGA